MRGCPLRSPGPRALFLAFAGAHLVHAACILGLHFATGGAFPAGGFGPPQYGGMVLYALIVVLAIGALLRPTEGRRTRGWLRLRRVGMGVLWTAFTAAMALQVVTRSWLYLAPVLVAGLALGLRLRAEQAGSASA